MHGISLSLFWVTSLVVPPPKLLCTPIHWGRVRNRKDLDAVHTLFGNSQNTGVLSALVTNTAPSPLLQRVAPSQPDLVYTDNVSNLSTEANTPKSPRTKLQWVTAPSNVWAFHGGAEELRCAACYIMSLHKTETFLLFECKMKM